MKNYIFAGLFLFMGATIQAQQFGGFPPSVRWMQINTNAARIIYPAAVDSQAQEIAAIIQRVMAQQPNPLGSHERKINIILHNNTTLANGYVALAPFRSEYYLVPGSDIFEFGANPWHRELAVHEFRHVLQFSNFNRGLSKVGSVLFGEEGQALFNALAIPDWFWEGDAVHAETALTPQGRGRTPFFFNGYRSIWREGRNYSWMKLRNGSLKDYVPDHYHLGYLLVNYGYLKYGPDFWEKVTRDAAGFKGLFYPFQKAVKTYSGLDYKTFRQQALAYYSHEVSRKRTDRKESAVVTHYYFPQYISTDSLLYLKDSYRSLPAFYLRTRGTEHRLALQNISTETWFSYRNGVIAYTAYETDPRWPLVDYSSIYLYHLRSGKQSKITRKAKYFTPDIAPSGDRIIAVYVDSTTATFLHLMDLSGRIIQTILPAAHTNFVHPRFIDDHTIVVTERLPNSTMQMSRIDLATGRREVLIPSTSALLGYPYPHGGSIYFVSSLSGTDELYSLRLSDSRIFRLTTGSTGSYYPSVYRDSLLWSSFSGNGLLLKSAPLPGAAEEVKAGQWKEVTLPYPIAPDSSNVLAGGSLSLPSARYRQGAHLFDFHSWRPDYTDPELTLSLFSDNMLNTFSNQLYYRYNRNETSHALGFTSSYGGLYPVISGGLEYTWNRTFRDTARQFEVNEAEAHIGYSVPLNFTGGKMYRFLDFGSDYVLHQSWLANGSKDSSKNTYSYLRHFLSWAHYLPMARQQIYPKFGYTLLATHRHLLSEKGFQFLASGQLFLPSLGNHSIVLTGSWQETDTSNIVFSNRFANSRGYDDYYFSRMWRVGANYHFPIAYPDLGLANIYYLQRLRGNLFYDFTRVYSRNKKASRDLRSAGAELYFDSKIWNELPLSFGVRASYLLDNGFNSADKRGNIWFELILPLSLIPQ